MLMCKTSRVELLYRFRFAKLFQSFPGTPFPGFVFPSLLSCYTPAQYLTLFFLTTLPTPPVVIPLHPCACVVLSCFSRIRFFETLWTVATRLLCPCDSSGKDTGVGYHLSPPYPSTMAQYACLQS